MSVGMRASVHACTHIHARTHAHTHHTIYIYIYICVCVYIYIHACIPTYVYTYGHPPRTTKVDVVVDMNCGAEDQNKCS